MLENSFYTVTGLDSNSTSTIDATLSLNPQHDIFKGHFPGHPVVPGVCMLQIIKECLEKIFGRKLMLTQASGIKFLAMLNPEEESTISLNIKFNATESGATISEAIIISAKAQFLKLTGASYVAQ